MTLQSCNNNSTALFITQLRHRPVRDLAWALLSPSLFESINDFKPEWLLNDYIDKNDVSTWLKTLDSQPKALLDHLLQQRSTRLGIYFEQLLSFYFEHFPRFSLLAKNLQINSPTRTLGEFDFIIEDHLDKSIKHIEVAVKFYLGHPRFRPVLKKNINYYDWHHWVGPNQKDTLAIKMRHLQQHQLPIIKTQEGRSTLSTLLNDARIDKCKKISSRLLVKGRFYLPSNKEIAMPTYANRALKEYFWIETNKLHTKKDFLNDKLEYCFLPRDYWLSELSSADIKENKFCMMNAKTLKESILDQDSPLINDWQIAGFNFTKSKFELNRFFIINSQNLPSDE